MPYALECITCGHMDNVENTKLCLPIPNKILFDAKKIKNYIASQSKAVFFIIIFLDLFGGTIDSLLTVIGSTENIAAIYICGNQIYNSGNDPINVFHLPRRLITSSTVLHAIRAYRSASQRLFESGHKGDGIVCEQKSYDLKRWLTTNNKAEACDILIIPLNTADDNLLSFQQELIELCNDLCHDYEARVCTIDDYICPVKLHADMSKEEQAFINKQNEMICTLLRDKLARIRIYLVGNEEHISNQWSKFMIENEPYDGSLNEVQYDERCTFFEYEPVTTETIRRLDPHDASLRRATYSKPIRLDRIQDDVRFLLALDRGRLTLGQREMVADSTLSQWTMNYHEKSTEYTNEFHVTDEARNVPMDQDDNLAGEMDNTIQSNYRTHFAD